MCLIYENIKIDQYILYEIVYEQILYMHYYEEPNKYVYKIYIQTLCIIYDHYQIFIIII